MVRRRQGGARRPAPLWSALWRRAAPALLAVLIAASLAAPAAARTPREFYGVVAQGGVGPPDPELMQYARVGTLRFHFDWRSVQSEPGRCQAAAEVGVCDWRAFDYGIGLFAASGIRAFPFLLNVPWFVDPDSNMPPIRSRADRRAWTGFLTAAVRRYGRGGEYWKRYYPQQFPNRRPKPVTHWEVWNEPSDGSYWRPRPNPREYARLLAISGRAIHRAERAADVVFAGLFGTPTEDNNGIKAYRFYRRALSRPGLGRHFDEVGVHPYGPTMKRVATQMGWVREEMRRAGFGRRRIWVTEIAWSSSEPPTILGVGPEGQARMLSRAFDYFERRRRRWRIEGVHWYSWQDLPEPGLCEFCEESGLVTFDRRPKPSYYAFARAAG